MKQIKTKNSFILAVEIPEGITWCSILENNLDDFITKELDLPEQFLQYGKRTNIFGEEVYSQVYYNPNTFYLPKGKFKILGKLSELSDKNCWDFVEKSTGLEDTICFKDYTLEKHFTIKNPKESFISLLKSEDVDISKEQLILQLL